MNFVFCLWVEAAAADDPFTEAALRGWHEPPAFTALVAAVAVPAAQTRFAALRDLRPVAAYVP